VLCGKKASTTGLGGGDLYGLTKEGGRGQLERETQATKNEVSWGEKMHGSGRLCSEKSNIREETVDTRLHKVNEEERRGGVWDGTSGNEEEK